MRADTALSYLRVFYTTEIGLQVECWYLPPPEIRREMAEISFDSDEDLDQWLISRDVPPDHGLIGPALTVVGPRGYYCEMWMTGGRLDRPENPALTVRDPAKGRHCQGWYRNDRYHRAGGRPARIEEDWTPAEDGSDPTILGDYRRTELYAEHGRLIRKQITTDAGKYQEWYKNQSLVRSLRTSSRGAYIDKWYWEGHLYKETVHNGHRQSSQRWYNHEGFPRFSIDRDRHHWELRRTYYKGLCISEESRISGVTPPAP